jgi:hypothetical protein
MCCAKFVTNLKAILVQWWACMKNNRIMKQKTSCDEKLYILLQVIK